MYQKAQMSFLYVIVFLLLVNSVLTPETNAQDEPALLIEIYDTFNWNESAGNVFFEGRTYDIIVSSENETVLGVNISFLGVIYTTSMRNPYITVSSPPFNTSQPLMIIAEKQGYLTAEVEITIMKGQLSVTTDREIIEEKKGFQVTVEDQNHKPVEGALVYVTPQATPVITDLKGIAYVQAPEIEMATVLTIQVIKSGYFPGLAIIHIENVEGFMFNITNSKFLQVFPILLAVFVVIFAIIYVVLRQKRIPITPREIIQKPADMPNAFKQEKHGPRFKNDSAIFHVKGKRNISISTPQSRVEEIRIPVNQAIKETTILSKNKEAEGKSVSPKKELDDWFKGQDYMRYKIDELTGKIDQKTDGKWFEGQPDSQDKVDETLRKNLKKKKIDNEDI